MEADGDRIAWTSDKHLLLKQQIRPVYYLIDAVAGIPLWRYADSPFLANKSNMIMNNGLCWLYIEDRTSSSRGLVPFKLPQPAALKVAADYKVPQVSYALLPGAKVQVTTSGFTDGSQEQLAKQALTLQLQSLGYVIDPNALCVVSAIESKGEPENLNYQVYSTSFPVQSSE